jgi:LysR family hca operon transcriptional activator
MELRHLRYFIAVAEAGSLTVAAEKKLHTAQPSLSRQIRDLEYEVGVQLMSRSVLAYRASWARTERYQKATIT